jgi:hypothetical protein
VLGGDAFAGAHAIAGSLQPLERLRVASGRRYPFYWWSSRTGSTRYAMKRSVAELFRLARVALSQPERLTEDDAPGVPYRPQDEHVSVAPPAPGVAADPDIYGRGLQAHQRLQNHLADLATACGRNPLSASPTEPSYDLAWMTDTSVMVVVEVKSTTAGNEVRQLRMGLGQILDYTSSLQRCGHTVQPVLHVECEPADAQRWLDITERTGVLLTWPGTEDRLGLPTSGPAAPPSPSVERVQTDNPRWLPLRNS